MVCSIFVEFEQADNTKVNTANKPNFSFCFPQIFKLFRNYKRSKIVKILQIYIWRAHTMCPYNKINFAPTTPLTDPLDIQ